MQTPNIDVNSTDNTGETPIRDALEYNKPGAAMLLIENGANLFMINTWGESIMADDVCHQVLDHAKNVVWALVKPLLLLSKSFSNDAPSSDPSIAIPSAVVSVLTNSHLVRECMAPFLLNTDIIIEDPEITRKRKEEAKKRRAGEACAKSSNSSSSSSSSGNKMART